MYDLNDKVCKSRPSCKLSKQGGSKMLCARRSVEEKGGSAASNHGSIQPQHQQHQCQQHQQPQHQQDQQHPIMTAAAAESTTAPAPEPSQHQHQSQPQHQQVHPISIWVQAIICNLKLKGSLIFNNHFAIQAIVNGMVAKQRT